MRGYGLFDFFRTYNQKPFKWDWYWERFERSTSSMKLSIPITKDQALGIVLELIERQGQDCSIRFLLTGGVSSDSVLSIMPSLLIVSEDLVKSPAQFYDEGIKVISYEYTRDLPEVKTTDYKHFMLIQDRLKKEKAQGRAV